MNYLQPYTAATADQTVLSAWDTQVAHAAEAPWLDRLLLDHGSEIFAEFTSRYNELRALPRSARRALQRSLARSSDSEMVPPEWRRKLAFSVAGAALLLALAGSAEAGSMTVTAKTPPGINADGRCSLIEAIVNANNGATVHSDCPGATGGPNTINLPSGTQTLTYSYGFYYSYGTGLPKITSSITIQGNSKAKIVRGKTAPDLRHFAVGPTGDLTLNEVALSGGSAIYGGSIFNYKGSVTLNWCTVSGNFAGKGGAIDNYKGYLAINDYSIFSRNAALIGGAIYNRGGGAFGYGEVVLHDSLITGNKSLAGGGIFNTGYHATLFIHHTTFSKNTAYYYGGAIYDYYGDVYLYDNSLITTNKAGRYGGGLFSKESGFYTSYVKIDHTTISKNSAGVDGGGIYAFDSYLRMTNSSVTSNKAGRYGGGVLIGFSGYNLSGNSVIKNKAGVAGNDYYIFP